MIQIRCNRCNLPIPLTSAHVVQPGIVMVPGASASHWHVDCWNRLVAENKRKAEQSKPKV